MKSRYRIGLIFFIIFYMGTLSLSAGENRWVFCRNAMGNTADFEELKSIILKAKSAGFNGLVLSSRFDSLDLQPDSYRERISRLREFCDKNEFDLIPCGFSIGYAGAVLSHDENLAEGYPVRDLLFKACGAEAIPVAGTTGDMRFTADFEKSAGMGLVLEDPGKVMFTDRSVTRSGRPTLRMENLDYNRHGNARLCKELDVIPFQSYEISFWYRAENLPSGTPAMVQIHTMDGNSLLWKNMDRPANAWQRFSMDFNSLEHTKLRVYLGIWAGRTGRMWIDDLSIVRQKTITRIIRRTGAPVTIADARTGTVYTEGSDFSIREYPQSSHRFIIMINDKGRIQDDSLLKVSYYRSYVMGSDQVGACMAVPGIQEIWKRQMALIEELLRPKAYFLSMDEIRQGGYCESCAGEDMPALLGKCISMQYSMIKSVSRDAQVYIWADMLDPNAGATPVYCMVRGGFPHSWEHVPREILPVVWIFDSRDRSLSHFIKNGFQPTVSVNVDEGASSDRLKAWKKSFSGIPGKPDIIYTTWHDDYSHLKEFGEIFFD